MSRISIAGRAIGISEPPYLIAEVSANHGGSFERAIKIVRLAADCGAEAVKFQAYTPDSLTIDAIQSDFRIRSSTLWDGQSLYSLYRSAATPYEWLGELFSYARKLKITPLCSVFDVDGIKLLERLDVAAYKIASFEAIDLDLIRACAETGRPLIVSTGLCTAEEIDDILKASRAAGSTQLALLKCNSTYPANLREANLICIPDMMRRFDVPIGYSDHTIGLTTAVCACALGACLVEKHFIDSREPETPDSRFSMIPDEFRRLTHECRDAFLARGDISYGVSVEEEASLVFRRSLYAVADIPAGERLTAQNIRSIRPGFGLAPKHLNKIIGSIATCRIRRGEALRWEMIQ